MPKFKVKNNAVVYGGMRYEMGEVVTLEKKDAEAIGKDNLVPVGGKEEKEEKKDEKKEEKK
jgi:hypothetical protein